MCWGASFYGSFMTSGSYLDYYVYDKSNSHVTWHQKKKNRSDGRVSKGGFIWKKMNVFKKKTNFVHLLSMWLFLDNIKR